MSKFGFHGLVTVVLSSWVNDLSVYTSIYIYRNTPTTRGNAVARYPQSHRATDPEPNSPKIQNSKNPTFFGRCDKFWIFGIWIFGWVCSRSLDLGISGHQELYFRVPQVPGLDSTTIYICTISIYIHICALAKPGFCSGGRISCKPKNGALLSTSLSRHDDSKRTNSCALLGTRTNSNNDSKSIRARMDILSLLLTVILMTFIVQLIINVTMIATMVLLIMI